jgi:ribosomal protein S18 acetylase RimI-like enzyme
MYKSVEEITLNAWPSLQTIVYDGWLLRFAKGYTKRSNSINPIYNGIIELPKKIEESEKIYEQRELKVVFKITPFSFPEALDNELENRGYEIVEPSSVRVKKIINLEAPLIHTVSITEEMTTEWLDSFSGFTNLDKDNSAIQKEIIENIISKKVFVTLYEDDRPVACGLGVMNGDYIGLYDIVTGEYYRRRGYGKQLIINLLHWAREQGINNCYLQVVKSNLPANKLYDSLEFTEIYDYWYRVKK